MKRLILALLLAVITIPAYAWPGQDRCDPVAGTGILVDVRLRCANSWIGSGQVLRNIISYSSASVFDTDPQSSADFVLGVSAVDDATLESDPVGTAGHAGAYLPFDGTDMIAYTGRVGTTASVVDGAAATWHKTTGGQDFTFGIAGCWDIGGAVAQTIWTTKASGTEVGITAQISTAGVVSMTQNDGTTASTVSAAATLADGECRVLGFAHEAGTTNSYIWVGSATAEPLSHTFNTTTDDPTMALLVGGTYNAAFTVPSQRFRAGTKVYDIMIQNSVMTNTEFGGWITDIESGDGIDFTS